MPDLPPSLCRLIDRMRAATAETVVEDQILAAIEEPLRRAALDHDWLRPEFLAAPEEPGAAVALSLHAYGCHLNETGRHRFDVATQTMAPFVITPR